MQGYEEEDFILSPDSAQLVEDLKLRELVVGGNVLLRAVQASKCTGHCQ